MATTTPAGTTGTSESLANWVGPYTTQLLGQTNAYAAQPYQVYQGPLTAGSSPLQQQAFQGLGSLQVPGAVGQAANTAGQVAQTALGPAGQYSHTTFDTGLGPVNSVGGYMNPYMQGVVDIQTREARRQADISRMQEQARLAQAGAYGGSRQAVMEGMRQRDLQTQLGDIQATGLNTAYDKALQQRLAESGLSLNAQTGTEQSRQFGAEFGLRGLNTALGATQAQGQLGQMQNGLELGNLQAQLQGGQTQRGIEGEGIAADLNEFTQQRDWPMKMLQFKQSMLQGLPVGAVSYQQQQPSSLTNIMKTTGGLMELYNQLFPSTGTKP